MIVYKLPTGIDIEKVKALRGLEGSSLNPIEDIDGNFIISKEEVEAAEFSWIKEKYADLVSQITEIEYKQIPVEDRFKL